MKSGKQRRLEIKAKRRQRAEALKVDPYKELPRPRNSLPVNPLALAHNNTYGFLPSFYVDKLFTCIDCSAIEVYTAESQKWWYEIAKGSIYSDAIHCKSCRTIRKNEKQQQKERMAEMAKRKPHPHEDFFKKRYDANTASGSVI